MTDLPSPAMSTAPWVRVRFDRCTRCSCAVPLLADVCPIPIALCPACDRAVDMLAITAGGVEISGPSSVPDQITAHLTGAIVTWLTAASKADTLVIPVAPGTPHPWAEPVPGSSFHRIRIRRSGGDLIACIGDRDHVIGSCPAA